MTATTGDLATDLLELVDAQLTALADGPLPDLHLPHLLLGHEVGPDVRADLLFTLGLLHECGRAHVAGLETTATITRLLGAVDGRRTNTFYSYRVAETVGRFGAFDRNPVLEPLTDEQRDQVAAATDSTDWLELLDAGILPRNYAAVLARCENARRQLGLLEDTTRLDDLLGRVRSMLGRHLDDSNAAIGRYDIYSVDIHLFCEPLAPLIGEPWRAGARHTLDLVDRVATRDGAAVAWGRSTGILAVCHNIELAGLVARTAAGERGHEPTALTTDPGRWFARAAEAAAHLHDWFDDGWVTAHQYRSSDPYRGLDRRLQMTLDCLGKLVDTARGLQMVPDLHIPSRDLHPDRDELVWFDRGRNAGVWSFRSRDTAFTLPLVGGTTTDYLPAPRNPGLFEVPVGSELSTGTPLVLHRGARYASGGLPSSIEHHPGRVRARYDGFPVAGHLEPEPEQTDHGRSSRILPARRDVTWTVAGRTVHVEEHLEFDEAPDALAVQVTEAADRPLHVRVDTEHPHTTATTDVAGLAEYRSCWGELPRVHQVDLQPARNVSLRWSVTPVLRVVSTAAGDLYNDCLYAPLTDRVRVERLPHSTATDPLAAEALASRTDQFHLHWPEWLLIGGVDAHHRLIAALRAGGARIVWTQHNLIGHDKNREAVAFYEAWAGAADLVIHHSEWGRDRATTTYRYGEHTRHVVIPHGHFGPSSAARRTGVDRGREPGRTEIEAELGLRPGAIRLAVVGAPRVEKDVELVMRAVARSAREDLELVVWSLRGDEQVPDDPRIVAVPYELVDRDEYDRRLGAVDALVMPFDPDGEMLTTGTIGDALGFGLPTIASSWAFLAESLGDAAITYGRTEDDLIACLDGLERTALDVAATAAVERRPRHDWSTIAERTYAELDRLGSTHH